MENPATSNAYVIAQLRPINACLTVLASSVAFLEETVRLALSSAVQAQTKSPSNDDAADDDTAADARNEPDEDEMKEAGDTASNTERPQPSIPNGQPPP